jgi:hypothetical protein
MKYRRFEDKVIVRMDKGEEIVKTLKKLCEILDIKLGVVMGIGATNRCMISVFDTREKTYHSQEFVGDHEIASMFGNVSTLNGEIFLHLHANLCDKKNRSFGGHLNSAVVSATFEAVIDIVEGKIDRSFDVETGLNLMKI